MPVHKANYPAITPRCRQNQQWHRFRSITWVHAKWSLLSCLWPAWKRADHVLSYRGSTRALYPQAQWKEAFYHRCVVFSLGSLKSQAPLSFGTILEFSLRPDEIFVLRLPCRYFLHKQSFEFCAYTVAVSFLSLSTCFTALHTRMIISLTRSTGRLSGIVDTFVVRDLKNDWKKSNCWYTAILCQCYACYIAFHKTFDKRFPKFVWNYRSSLRTWQFHFVLVNQIVNLERWEINKFIAREVRAVGSDCLGIP